MEDSHIADVTSLGQGKYIFGVFDGHGGIFLVTNYLILLGMEVAEFVKRHFVKELVKNENFKKGKY